jgi:hypothetical protein
MLKLVKIAVPLLAISIAGLSSAVCGASPADSALGNPLSAALSAPGPEPTPVPARRSGSESKVGFGVTVSLLGAGFEVATPITSKMNLRGGFNAFNYNRNYSKDGINYAGKLDWRSGEMHLDWFPFRGGFHLSPGVMLYNGNKVTATAAVPAGQTFTLNNVSYVSSATSPVNGTGTLGFNKAAPTFLVGFGNLVPRSGRHWSVLFDIGVAYQGTPKAALALTGSACVPPGQVACSNVATDPQVQTNLQAEQTKINNDLKLFKFYPLISLGFGFNF